MSKERFTFFFFIMCKRYANLPSVIEFKKHFFTSESEKQRFYELPDKIMSSRALAKYFYNGNNNSQLDKTHQTKIKVFNDAYIEYFRTKVLNNFF